MHSDTHFLKKPVREKGFYYGYVVVFVAFLIMTVAYGTRFAFGVFFKPMLSDFGWSSAQTSLAFSISSLFEGIMGVVMGHLTDRLGPRIVVTSGGILVGIGYLAMSQITAVWQFYLLYGVLIGIGMGGFFVPLVVTTARWFNRRRAMMTGVVISGNGIGTVIVAPIASWMIYSLSWQTSYLIFGVVLLVLVITAAQFIKRDSSTAGQFSEDGQKDKTSEISEDRSFTPSKAIRTMQFWFIIVLSLCFGFCTFSTNVHLVPVAIYRGISAASSAFILGLTGGVRVLGNVSMGKLADRIGRKCGSTIGFVFMFAALLLLLPATGLWTFYLFAIIFGFGYGAAASCHSPLVTEHFGLKSHGLIYGFCALAYTFGGALGPYLTGYLFDASGSYYIPFLVNTVVAFIGLIIMSGLSPPRKSVC